MQTNYTSWGTRELIEHINKLEHALQSIPLASIKSLVDYTYANEENDHIFVHIKAITKFLNQIK
jgi:hypothetical protein